MLALYGKTVLIFPADLPFASDVLSGIAHVAVAERIVAKLRRKMARFALLVSEDLPADPAGTGHDVLTEAHEALIALGHSPAEARRRIDEVCESGAKFKSVEELLSAVYRQHRED